MDLSRYVRRNIKVQVIEEHRRAHKNTLQLIGRISKRIREPTKGALSLFYY